MNYCSACGSDRLRQQVPEGDTVARLVCQHCGYVHYAPPRIVVCAVPIYRGQMLLSRRAIGPAEGLWNVPAGYLEKGETPAAGALRELQEETGATGRIIRPLTLFSIPSRFQLDLHFLIELDSNHVAPGPESSEVRFFAFDQIPSDQLAFRSCELAVARYLAQPDYPGVFVESFEETA